MNVSTGDAVWFPEACVHAVTTVDQMHLAITVSTTCAVKWWEIFWTLVLQNVTIMTFSSGKDRIAERERVCEWWRGERESDGGESETERERKAGRGKDRKRGVKERRIKMGVHGSSGWGGNILWGRLYLQVPKLKLLTRIKTLVPNLTPVSQDSSDTLLLQFTYWFRLAMPK